MAHEIDVSTGKPAFFSLRTPAWHGLGTVVQEPLTCREAIELAGLNYEVTLQPIVTTEGNAIHTHFATRREDTKAILGVVGERFTPLQNKDAFAPFEELVTNKTLEITTAGALRGGSRMFLTCKAPSIQTSIKGDDVEGYFLLANGHDGSLCLHMGFTPIRVVCANTLAMARQHTASSLIRVKHTKSIKQVAATLVQQVDWVTKEFKITTESYNFLAGKVVNKDDLRQYIIAALELDTESKQAQSTLDNLLYLSQAPTNNTNASKGTWWGAYNTISEYLTHEAGRTQENRLMSQWFGDAAKTTHEAFKMAVGFANKASDARNNVAKVFDLGSYLGR